MLPGIAFSLDLIETTREYGVSEVLMSSFMAAFIFSVLGAQPLTVAGVTGAFAIGSSSGTFISIHQVPSPFSIKLSMISSFVGQTLQIFISSLVGSTYGQQ